MKIKINQSGEVIGLPGLKQKIRTPSEFNISEDKLNRVVLSLLRQGITNFSVEHGSSVTYEQERRNKENNVESFYSDNLDVISRSVNVLENKIDYLIDRINNLETTKEVIYKHEKTEEDKPIDRLTKEAIEEEEEEDFIPNIHLDGFKKHGDGVDKVERKGDEKEVAENLSKKYKKES